MQAQRTGPGARQQQAEVVVHQRQHVPPSHGQGRAERPGADRLGGPPDAGGGSERRGVGPQAAAGGGADLDGRPQLGAVREPRRGHQAATSLA